MARVNVYVPDELAEAARRAGLNVSALTQEALRSAIDAQTTNTWLDRVARLRRTGIDHDTVIEALEEARAELADA
jgi:post-segregation antitoxin (ccd killing protein)